MLEIWLLHCHLLFQRKSCLIYVYSPLGPVLSGSEIAVPSNEGLEKHVVAIVKFIKGVVWDGLSYSWLEGKKLLNIHLDLMQKH